MLRLSQIAAFGSSPFFGHIMAAVAAEARKSVL
jgi:hypothetical protein